MIITHKHIGKKFYCRNGKIACITAYKPEVNLVYPVYFKIEGEEENRSISIHGHALINEITNMPSLHQYDFIEWATDDDISTNTSSRKIEPAQKQEVRFTEDDVGRSFLSQKMGVVRIIEYRRGEVEVKPIDGSYGCSLHLCGKQYMHSCYGPHDFVKWVKDETYRGQYAVSVQIISNKEHINAKTQYFENTMDVKNFIKNNVPSIHKSFTRNIFDGSLNPKGASIEICHKIESFGINVCKMIITVTHIADE